MVGKGDDEKGEGKQGKQEAIFFIRWVEHSFSFKRCRLEKYPESEQCNPPGIPFHRVQFKGKKPGKGEANEAGPKKKAQIATSLF